MTLKAYQLFIQKLNPIKFDSKDAQLKEWTRVVNKLLNQGCLVFQQGHYVYTHIKLGSVYLNTNKTKKNEKFNKTEN